MFSGKQPIITFVQFSPHIFLKIKIVLQCLEKKNLIFLTIAKRNAQSS